MIERRRRWLLGDGHWSYTRSLARLCDASWGRFLFLLRWWLHFWNFSGRPFVLIVLLEVL